MHAYADKLDTYTDAAKATAVRFVVAGDNALHGYVTYSDLRQVLGRTRMGFAFHAPPGTTVSVPHPDDAIERRDSVETSSRSSSSSSSEHTDQVVAETIAMVGKKRHRQKKIDKNEEEDEEIDDDESEGMHNLPVRRSARSPTPSWKQKKKRKTREEEDEKSEGEDLEQRQSELPAVSVITDNPKKPTNDATTGVVESPLNKAPAQKKFQIGSLSRRYQLYLSSCDGSIDTHFLPSQLMKEDGLSSAADMRVSLETLRPDQFHLFSLPDWKKLELPEEVPRSYWQQKQ